MRTFLVLLKKEFIQIKRNPFLLRIVLAFPFMLMLLMPLIMTMDVKNVNVALVDLDKSTTSKRVASHIEASSYLTLKQNTSEFKEAMMALEEGDVDVIVQVSNNFERNMFASAPERISLTANAVNATKGGTGMQYVVQTIASTLKEVRGEKNPIKASDLVTVENRYNPTLNYRYYMIPALMIIVLILICGFVPALSIVGEKESGTVEQINVTPVSRFTFTLSKLLPYWIIGLVDISIAMLVAWLVYGLTPIGSVFVIYAGAICFILAISGLSVTIANYSSTMQQSIFVIFFFNMIFMLMSGMLTPIDSMPAWAQKITYFLPPRYFVDILRSVYLKGTTLLELWRNFVALGVFALALNVFAALTYKKRE